MFQQAYEAFTEFDDQTKYLFAVVAVALSYGLSVISPRSCAAKVCPSSRGALMVGERDSFAEVTHSRVGKATAPGIPSIGTLEFRRRLPVTLGAAVQAGANSWTGGCSLDAWGHNPLWLMTSTMSSCARLEASPLSA